jgi:ketosteroid isomerase-like protein
VKPSAEIKEAMLAAYTAYSASDAGVALHQFSHQEGVLAIGTDPNEWWSGYDAIAQIYQAQLPEMGGQVQIKAGNIQAYVEGTVGWAVDRAILQVLGREIPVRVTTIFHQEDGTWKVVHHHVSIGVPNTEVLGKELTTH